MNGSWVQTTTERRTRPKDLENENGIWRRLKEKKKKKKKKDNENLMRKSKYGKDRRRRKKWPFIDLYILMMGKKMIEKSGADELWTRAGVCHITERTGDVWRLGHLERTVEEDVVMRTWKWVDTERSENRNGGERNVMQKHEWFGSTERRTRPNDLANENGIWRRLKKKKKDNENLTRKRKYGKDRGRRK